MVIFSVSYCFNKFNFGNSNLLNISFGSTSPKFSTSSFALFSFAAFSFLISLTPIFILLEGKSLSMAVLVLSILVLLSSFSFWGEFCVFKFPLSTGLVVVSLLSLSISFFSLNFLNPQNFKFLINEKKSITSFTPIFNLNVK